MEYQTHNHIFCDITSPICKSAPIVSSAHILEFSVVMIVEFQARAPKILLFHESEEKLFYSNFCTPLIAVMGLKSWQLCISEEKTMLLTLLEFQAFQYVVS